MFRLDYEVDYEADWCNKKIRFYNIWLI
jgi:hypothetical protein